MWKKHNFTALLVQALNHAGVHMNIFDTLKQLTDAQGVAGNEGAVSQVALELLKEFDPNAHTDCFGSVVGFIGDRDNGNPVILLDAHIDQVGLIVTHIDDKGFIKAERCGGIDRRALAAQAVTIHSREPVKGVICTIPPHVSRGKKDVTQPMKADSIRIDAGLTKAQAQEVISLGDVATIDGELIRMSDKIVTGSALDDRAGVCAVLYALSLLKGNKALRFNIAVSFSAQEELGCRGATVTAYNAEPEYAVVVDVSYGLSPGCSSIEHKCGKLGGGPMLGYAPTLNREMFEGFKKIAREHDVAYQLEIMSRDTGGTNADSITTVKGGVKTALVSIPLRYMHTPVETADISDIEAAGHLIAAFIEEFEV
jgi:endoglucanase